MRYTLLELTQNILSSLDGDQVTSINDTTESQQVVEVIKTVYDDILSRSDLSVFKTLFNLTQSTDPSQPVIMTKPTNIDDIVWIKYNKQLATSPDPYWAELKFLPLVDFLRMSHEMLPSDLNTGTMTLTTADGFTATFYYRTDLGPTYFTSFDDNTVVFDAIDLAVDPTVLQTSKTICFGARNVDFVKLDTFTPSLQPFQFALLLNEAKSLAWTELKQTAHPKAEATARRNWRHLAKSRQHIPTASFLRGASGIDELPFFGRR